MCDTSTDSLKPSTAIRTPRGGHWVAGTVIVGKPRGWVTVRFAPRMKCALPLLLALALPLCGCMTPMAALKIGYVAIKAVVTVVDVLRPDEPEPEEGEHDKSNGTTQSATGVW